MPLAPDDIRAQQFRVAFRGYDIGEVDAFLDRVEEELTRLWATNARAEAATVVARPVAARPVPPPPAAGAGSPAAPARTADGGAADAGAADGGAASRALRTIERAQQMADQLIADAQGEAGEIRARARAEADAVLAGARAEAARVAAELRQRSQWEIDDLVASGRRLRAELDRLGEQERRCREAVRTWLEEHEQLFEQSPPTTAPPPLVALPLTGSPTSRKART